MSKGINILQEEIYKLASAYAKDLLEQADILHTHNGKVYQQARHKKLTLWLVGFVDKRKWMYVDILTGSSPKRPPYANSYLRSYLIGQQAEPKEYYWAVIGRCYY